MKNSCAVNFDEAKPKLSESSYLRHESTGISCYGRK